MRWRRAVGHTTAGGVARPRPGSLLHPVGRGRVRAQMRCAQLRWLPNTTQRLGGPNTSRALEPGRSGTRTATLRLCKGASRRSFRSLVISSASMCNETTCNEKRCTNGRCCLPSPLGLAARSAQPGDRAWYGPLWAEIVDLSKHEQVLSLTWCSPYPFIPLSLDYYAECLKSLHEFLLSPGRLQCWQKVLHHPNFALGPACGKNEVATGRVNVSNRK